VAALHSGSRAVGNKIAMHHIKVAHALMERCWITLPDKDLAYLVEGTPEFDRYIAELRWAQHFALLNREEFMDRVVRQFSEWMSQPVVEAERINCHPPHPHGRHVAASSLRVLVTPEMVALRPSLNLAPEASFPP
jgi:RNA-splicing ligase RtcB